MIEAWTIKRRPQYVTWFYALSIFTLLLVTSLFVIMTYFPASNHQTPLIIHIPEKSSVQEIAHILKENDLIWSETFFRLSAQFHGHDRSLRAGHFSIPPKSNQHMILYYLTTHTGSHFLVKVTIPEGFSIQQIAARLEQLLICTKEEFESYAHTKAKHDFEDKYIFLKDIPLSTLEGYLFPETYYFKQNEPINVVIKTMLDQFSINIWQPFQQEPRFKNLRYTFHELLTLSSMIQKESRVITEMPMISSVFYNRLKKRMRLASDPTVVYALGKSYKDRVYYKDLKIKSPYNTYRVGGFPPTPIAAVGLDAFLAACFPETSPYLFFVAKPDGSHYFSRTYQEHLAIQRKLKRQK